MACGCLWLPKGGVERFHDSYFEGFSSMSFFPRTAFVDCACKEVSFEAFLWLMFNERVV